MRVSPKTSVFAKCMSVLGAQGAREDWLGGLGPRNTRECVYDGARSYFGSSSRGKGLECLAWRGSKGSGRSHCRARKDVQSVWACFSQGKPKGPFCMHSTRMQGSEGNKAQRSASKRVMESIKTYMEAAYKGKKDFHTRYIDIQAAAVLK